MARTPMLAQYFRIREEHPGVLLAMRVGDFYEFYGEDAETAASALEITLTGREDGGTRIPMAGVPFHSVDKYLAKLVQKGFRVAICDQLEDPKQAKGLVKRGVTRILTPGTVLEDSMLTANQNNFLAAICVIDGRAGLAILEPSTGEFLATELGTDGEERLLHELARLRPTELLLGAKTETVGDLVRNHLGAAVIAQDSPATQVASRVLQEHFEVRNLQGFGLDDKPAAITAASMVLQYARKNHLALDHVDSLSTYSADQYMQLDLSTRRSLELTANLADGSRRYTLASVLDETVTNMGSRRLRQWVEQPLLDRETIQARLDAVERLVGNGFARGELRDALKAVSDIERLTSRTAAGLASPRDLGALRNSLFALPNLSEPLRKLGVGRVQELREQVSEHRELAETLERCLVKDPPPHAREGGIIPAGFDSELDALRDLSKNGKSYIAALEAKEREVTGINTLKVGFNSVFGYYLEITKQNIDRVPEHYIRKQTTANAERYITAELKEHESQVLGAEEKSLALESELFQKLRLQVASHARELLQTARALAEIDVLAGLAEVAAIRGYAKPELLESTELEIIAGRHAVVEAHATKFVPNDVALRPQHSLVILTGPNMSGKSTYLRQTALIVLMAQIGSFVPARGCRMGICERIFARIGAKDELALGQSTFMVEMVESANILNHATDRSLVILDEIGRGTSTYDGLAIAWAMAEHLSEVGAKTLFATHYHQLNALADQLENVANYRVAVEEKGDDLVWTHRVLPGGTDRSYGIHVARMAGVPGRVLRRAQTILQELEGKSSGPKIAHQTLQLTLFEAEEPEVVQALKELDVNQLTPLEALQVLDRWKRNWS
jgi:DNA mismatch repair protein MutS